MTNVKLIRNCVGLAMLGAIGQQAVAQEARHAVRPTEHVSIEPVTFEWSELLQMQATLPVMATLISSEPTITIEPPIIDVPMAGAKTLKREMPAGVEKLGPCTGFASEPPIGLAFDSQLDVPDGLGFSFIPPDVAGGVGPRHLMTMLENQVLVTDRLSGSPVAVDTSVFWAPLGTTPASPTHVYPRVNFDARSGRWLASIRNGLGSLGATSIFFAISQTDDPTGTWDYYAIPADPLATSQADWLQLGHNDNWILFTANMFNLAGTGFLGVKMWAIDKATALVPGGPITVSIFPTGITAAVHGSGGNSVMPARTLDGDPTLWMCNTAFTSSGNFLVQLTQMTGTGPAPVVSAIAGSPFGGTTSFCFLSTNFSGTTRTMAQFGEPRFITSFSSRVASVTARNGKIWMAQASGLPGPSTNTAPTENGVIWHQIDPTLPFPGAPAAPGTMVLQSGAITNGTNTTSSYPSIAVNCAEDVLIGFANGDATISPRACYTFRLGTDALNFMGSIQELKAGESSYWKNFGVGTTAQYGRYSAAAVDPNDDKTLWTLQQYADTRVGPADNDSRWGTYWGRFGDCEELPVIIDDPDSLSGCVGDPASFSVAATSSTPLTYQWRLNGVDILGANSATYSIPVTVGADEGSYDVVVCGCGQAISLPATLEFGEPTITTQPTDYTTPLGGPAAFFVVATPILGSLNYQWFHGNTPVGTNDDIYVIGATVASDYYPSNEYRCVVSDDCGPIASNTVKLRYPAKGNFDQAEFDLHIFKNPTSLFGCTGETATFSVLAFPPTVTYEWRKNGTTIPLETGSSLTLSGLSAADVASYDVVVSLGARSRTSSAAALTVNDPPVITVNPSPSSQSVSPGAIVEFSVTATGTGTLTYQWQKKPQVPFANWAPVLFATSPTLTVGPITSDDAGLYRCVVTNACGFDRSSGARIVVN